MMTQRKRLGILICIIPVFLLIIVSAIEYQRTLLAKGAAKLKYNEIYNNVYRSNSDTSLQFSQFSLGRKKGKLGGQMLHQYIWTYGGPEDIGPWNQFSVFLAPTEDRIWVDKGASF